MTFGLISKFKCEIEILTYTNTQTKQLTTHNKNNDKHVN